MSSKNAYILTFHGSVNYGAALQAIALYKTVKNINGQCKLIDYNRKTHHNNRCFPKLKGSFKGKIYKLLHYELVKHLRESRNFNRFLSQNTEMTKKSYNCAKALSRSDFDPEDIYIVGSDQIWNCEMTLGDLHYFLDFVDSENKYSYAASFGKTYLDDQYHEDCRALLEKFKRISIREESGNAVLNELIGRECDVVCDPTFLLTADEWRQIAVAPKEKNKYVLIFTFVENQALISEAKMLADKLGCQLVNIAYSENLEGAKNISGLGPDKWLGYIENAEAVFTDSFHGFALSLNLGKRVYVNISDKSKSSRIIDAAKRYGASDSIFEGKIKTIEYDMELVLQNINDDREKGKKFLEDIIKCSSNPEQISS